MLNKNPYSALFSHLLAGLFSCCLRSSDHRSLPRKTHHAAAMSAKAKRQPAFRGDKVSVVLLLLFCFCCCCFLDAFVAVAAAALVDSLGGPLSCLVRSDAAASKRTEKKTKTTKTENSSPKENLNSL